MKKKKETVINEKRRKIVMKMTMAKIVNINEICVATENNENLSMAKKAY